MGKQRVKESTEKLYHVFRGDREFIASNLSRDDAEQLVAGFSACEPQYQYTIVPVKPGKKE